MQPPNKPWFRGMCCAPPPSSHTPPLPTASARGPLLVSLDIPRFCRIRGAHLEAPLLPRSDERDPGLRPRRYPLSPPNRVSKRVAPAHPPSPKHGGLLLPLPRQPKASKRGLSLLLLRLPKPLRPKPRGLERRLLGPKQSRRLAPERVSPRALTPAKWTKGVSH